MSDCIKFCSLFLFNGKFAEICSDIVVRYNKMIKVICNTILDCVTYQIFIIETIIQKF